ncbi:hypothetical protein [Bradyrhizobium oligotrophicum]|uniref:hypothetical protein n=1 Tax=Bradyrhizobium oligotrophicum TaxID=44255 RepID=UPI003EB9BE4D
MAAITAVLARYPEDIIRDATHPATGLPIRCDFLPSVAEVYRECEARMQPRRIAWAVEERRVKQLQERAEFERRFGRRR